MSNYSFLLGLLVLLWVIVYYCNRKEIFTPSSVVIIMEIISLILALIGRYSWNTVRDLDIKTVVFDIISLVSFSFGGLLASNRIFKVKRIRLVVSKSYDIRRSKITEHVFEPYQMNNVFHGILLLFTVLIFGIYCFAMFQTFGSSDILSIMASGHSAYFNSEVTIDSSMNSLAVQSARILKAIAYAYILICSYNIANRKKIIKSFFVPIVLYIICLGLRGTRHNIILTIIAFVLMTYIFLVRSDKWNIGAITRKVAMSCLVLLILLFAGFYVLAPLLGQNTHDDAVAYLTYYFGATIPSKNEALIHPSFCRLTRSDIWGIHVFSGFYQSLNGMGILDVNIPKQVGWVTFSRVYPSNIFSAPFVLYLDFGYVGMILLSVIEGFIYTYLYKSVRKIQETAYLVFAAFVYLAPSVFNWYRTEDLFSAELSSVSLYIGIIITAIILEFGRIKIKIRKYR